MSCPRVPRRLRKIVKAAEAAGWTYEVSSKNHPRLVPPAGTTLNGERCGPIQFSSTPSDARSDKNAIARLRRAGLDV